MPQATIGRWDDGLAVRLPAEIVDAAGLHDAQHVEIEAHDGAIIIRPTAAQPTWKELCSGRTPEAWRAEYADASDWGPDVGQEILPP